MKILNMLLNVNYVILFPTLLSCSIGSFLIGMSGCSNLSEEQKTLLPLFGNLLVASGSLLLGHQLRGWTENNPRPVRKEEE